MTDMRTRKERREDERFANDICRAFNVPRYIVDGSPMRLRDRFWRAFNRVFGRDRWYLR